MTNGNKPITSVNKLDDIMRYGAGLTKREYFAAMAMQGIMSYGWNIHEYNEASKAAVSAADALIKALNEQP